MIQKRLIAALVGGFIVFVWQASSWMFLGIHDSEAKYHPQQDAVLQTLSTANTAEGSYLLPTLEPSASEEDHMKFRDDLKGKPFAIVTYVKSYNADMAMPMLRGFLANIFLVYLLIYMFTRGGLPTPTRIVAASFSAGLFTWLWEPYMSRIWFQTPWSTIFPHLIDSLAAWTLCGLWLAWFYSRRNNRIVEKV